MKLEKRQYIDKQELWHRVCNGFITSSGWVDDDIRKPFVDVWENAGFKYGDEDFNKFIECLAQIIDSMPVKTLKRKKRRLRIKT